MIFDLAMGVVLGLSAGLAPGPLLALALSETLRGGFRAGAKVALAPLVTDGPILLAALFLLASLPARGAVLGAVSFAGAAFVAWLGVRSLRVSDPDLDTQKRLGSLKKAVALNFLSPHPYLFWIAVGGPRAMLAAERSVFNAALFVLGFYATLVGATMALAFLAARSRKLLSGRGYVWTMRSLGAALIVLAALLARDGIRLLAS